MNSDQRALKTRQLAGFKARENQCEDTTAAIARLEAELAVGADDQVVDQVAAQLRSDNNRLALELAEVRDQLAAEQRAHAATREQLAGATAATAKARTVRIRKPATGAKRTRR